MKRLGGVALLGLVSSVAGCSRVDLYPITGTTAVEDGGRSGSGSSGAGSGGSAAADGSGGTAGEGTAGGGMAGAGMAGGGTAGGTAGGGTASGGAPSACPAVRLSPGDSNRSLLVGGRQRNYILHIPPGYDGLEGVPLVVDFHGLGESGSSELSSSPYRSVLDDEGVVMAFPDGLAGPAGRGWNVGPCCVAEVDDVAFTRAVLADISDVACIDPKRIYAVGLLTGGGMAHYLACHAADLFAAVSPAAFDLLEENVDDCLPARPISVVSFRGTADSRVPYEGGESALVPGMPLTFLGAEATFERWAEMNGCAGMASPTDEHGCRTYADCRGGAEVTLCTEQGGREEHGDPNVAWPLLARHTL